jgi:hypothetical protein
MAAAAGRVDPGGTTAMIEILIIGFIVLVVIFIILLIHFAGTIKL